MELKRGSRILTLGMLGGEFPDRAREALFRKARFEGDLRHARVLFLLIILLSLIFIPLILRTAGIQELPASDLAVAQAETVTAFLVSGGVSLLCLLASIRMQQVFFLEAVYVTWEWGLALAGALFVSVPDEMALAAVMLLPCIFYLGVPISFAWRVFGGVGGSLLLLASYLYFAPEWVEAMPLTLAMAGLNIGLVLMVVRTNHLERQQWEAILAERRANLRLRESENRLEQTFQAVPLPLIVTRLIDGQMLKFNAAAHRFYGGSAEAFAGLRCSEIYVEPKVREMMVARLRKQEHVTDFETPIRLANGEVRTVMMAAQCIRMGGHPSLVAALVDVTERNAVEQKIRYVALHDTLTGLPNRMSFQESLQAALEQRQPEQSICLLLVDLDRLKDVNDGQGHDAGDAVLRETSHRIASLVGDRGLVARLGGDEFIVMLVGHSALQQGEQMARAISTELRRPIVHQGWTFVAQASIGIAACPEHDRISGDLMKDADLALHAAKQQGGNRFMCYMPAMRQAVQTRLSQKHNIMAALDRDEIIPYYQPKVSLATGHLEGFEALVRWHPRGRPVLGPAAFPMALSDPEMAELISERMVEKVTQDVRNWIFSGIACGRVAINLSAAQFTHKDLAANLLKKFRSGGVDPAHFEVEITETVFLGQDLSQVREILEELRSAGVGVSFDDFGTGYASLVHLKQLPIDVVKIDRGFVQDIENDPFDTAIVRAVIELAQDLRLRVVAEGVETEEQAHFLRRRGCHYAQGFLFYRPMPVAEASLLLEAENEDRAAERLAMFH
ncbi:MAG: putative bifunctional diguanylate cyclase/phosphodiesterase [Xanthobacter sp.]